MYANLELFIDGQWLNGDGRRGEDVINPATEKPLAHLPHASTADLDHALEAARKGFAVWRNTSAYDRAKIMRKAADLMRERHDAISKTLVQEQGKAYPEARAEVITSADIIEWYAEEGRRAYGRIVPGRGKAAAARDPGAGRHCRRIHAVEFPDADARAQDRRRAGCRLLPHPQGIRGNAGRLRRDGALFR